MTKIAAPLFLLVRPRRRRDHVLEWAGKCRNSFATEVEPLTVRDMTRGRSVL